MDADSCKVSACEVAQSFRYDEILCFYVFCLKMGGFWMTTSQEFRDPWDLGFELGKPVPDLRPSL